MTYKTMMVHLELGKSNDRLLAIVDDLVAQFGASVIGIAGCQPLPILYEQQAYISAEVLEADRKEIEKELQKAKAAFNEKIKVGPERASWRCTITPGSLADYIANEARAADLLITGPDIGGSIFDPSRRVRIADVVFRAGRPVLIVPADRAEIDLNHVVVGWKATPGCRRAVAAALPMLKRARHVTVAAIAGEGNLPAVKEDTSDVAQWLKRHGIAAVAKTAAANGPDASRFAELVDEMGAQLVVAGAYGYSRFREWVLGGVTGDYLMAPDRPVLLSH